MLKKLYLLLLCTVPLFAQNWYTATSISLGAKYFDQFDSGDKKIEEFFIHKAHPRIYYKIGVYSEQLAHWPIGNGQYTEPDTSTSLEIGAGYNLLTLGSFFIDGGLSMIYRTAYSSNETYYKDSIGTEYYLLSEYHDDPFGTFLDLGIGVALGSFTVRLDLSATGDGLVQLKDAMTGNYLSTEVTYSRAHANLGIAYWW